MTAFTPDSKILNDIFNNTPVGMCITNGNGLYDFVNRAYCRIYGYEAEELIGRSFLTVVPEDQHKLLEDLHNDFLKNGVEVHGEWEVVDKKGRVLSIIADALRVFGSDGNARKVTFVIDITELKSTAEKLQESKDFLTRKVSEKTSELNEIIDHLKNQVEQLYRTESKLLNIRKNLQDAQRLARLGSWEWIIEQNRIEWSDETFRIFGLDPDLFEATLEAYLQSVHPDDRQMLSSLIEKTLKEKESYTIEHRVVHSDGTELTVQGMGQVEVDESGKPVRFYGTVQDITDKVETDRQIRRLTRVLQESSSIIIITDADRVIEYVNSRFEEVTGYRPDQAIGQKAYLFTSYDRTRSDSLEIWNTISTGNSWRGRFKNRRMNGEYFWVEATISPIQDETGKITNYLAIEDDITSMLKAEEQAKYLTTFDKTTGLYNRSSIIGILEKKIVKKSPFSLLMIDIDDFRLINENYGLRVGDLYLQAVVKTVKGIAENCCSGKYHFGRLGEDDLLLILPEIHKEIGNEINSAVETLRVGTESVESTVSIGVAGFPEEGEEVKDLLTKLDIALYRAKEKGKNQCHHYTSDDDRLSEIHTRFSLRRRILDALEEDRFVIWFQPILNLESNQVHHFEVLVRMKEKDGSIALPGSFIPAAESFGLVGSIDRIVAQKAIAYQAFLAGKGIHISLSMNLSGKDLADEKLLGFLKNEVQESGADPEKIVFEITETAAIEDLPRAVEFIANLKELGCKFSLDDFGVGFTSFVYLRDLKVDFIKIDGAFVRSLSRNKDDRTIVKAVSLVARDMGIKSIAEFVQTEADKKILKDLGVDFVQGYLIGKPDPSPLNVLGIELV
ncbi:sensor domain-containing protein [Spirochaeta isovalerica]|uniref:Diguanylate cyclase (GGDEF)-like protein/PAS domain S-box-containing protein n=1 Tax=Spirochaeta isovalerica TaxID=150 RepID=A0A841R8X4_9SPIO|nr:EAL domain-containing protein [Spirochaeta isovalerica]MBB6480353.1 diguanylate cyclase (GGDEF)-like protein/PAS domain S-box-containing protein [Spirochaeta isovalerica]